MDRPPGRRVRVLWLPVAVGLCGYVLPAVSGAADVTVVSPTSPLPRVVSAKGRVHSDAAADLCDYLSRVTGRVIAPGRRAADGAVTIHVGPDAFVLKHAPEIKSLYADGFVLRHLEVDGQQHIVLSGVRLKSSRWAVEEFLMQFAGVRWLFPNTLYGEIVPSVPTVKVAHDLNQKHEPHYLSRGNLGMYYFDKNRRYLRRRPEGGGSFGSHEFQAIFNRADYQKHPEWFALFTVSDSRAQSLMKGTHPEHAKLRESLQKGQRRGRWHWDYGNGWQICMSNPQTVQHAVAYAREHFAKHPDVPTVSMGHNDSSGWCECDLCRKFAATADPPYTISERYWHWVNQVAKEVARTHPDKTVATLAYGAPGTPPRFELEKNISVMVTVYLESHLDLARQWQKKTDSVSLYSYAYGNSFVGFRHFPHAMRDFLKWGHDELGAIAHVSEVGGNWSFDGPKYRYMQELMWNVNADPDEIMSEFCRDWFGAGSQPMKAFWDRLEQVYERRGANRRFLGYQWVGWLEDHDEFDHYSLDDVSFLDKQIATAKQAVTTEADEFRVTRVADAWEYFRTFLLGRIKFTLCDEKVFTEAAVSVENATALAEELARLQDKKAAFLRRLRAYPSVNQVATTANYMSYFAHVTEFSDMRTMLDELCDQITVHLLAKGGRAEALAFWKKFTRGTSLNKSAQTQLFVLSHPERANLLANGGFETGDLSSWETSGAIKVMTESPRSGRFSAHGTGTLSQSIRVKAGTRYKLAVRGRYASPFEPGRRLFSSDVRFKSSGKSLWSEPNYRRLGKADREGEWISLGTTFTAPPGADTAVVSIRTTLNWPIAGAGKPVIWDDIRLEKILDEPAVKPGVLTDNFSGEHLDDRQWTEATSGSSGTLPRVRDGWLVIGQRPNATLVSMSRFDDLLNGTGDRRYRLRAHIAMLDAGRKASFECGIRTGVVPISIRDSGFWFTHAFSDSAEKTDALRTYWHQDGKRLPGRWFDVEVPGSAKRNIWYTFFFGPRDVEVYAGFDGYDERASALVGKYQHKMTNISSAGPIFLKMSGGNVKIGEISLMRPVR
ncbi:MAG: hypothetical protein CMJ68_09685 [Planctomycetaceae bacterium]|nr:hypothetical protein [Planctomycetaceae bacterium]